MTEEEMSLHAPAVLLGGPLDCTICMVSRELECVALPMAGGIHHYERMTLPTEMPLTAMQFFKHDQSLALS